MGMGTVFPMGQSKGLTEQTDEGAKRSSHGKIWGAEFPGREDKTLRNPEADSAGGSAKAAGKPVPGQVR